jgi:hypothetical protein
MYEGPMPEGRVYSLGAGEGLRIFELLIGSFKRGRREKEGLDARVPTNPEEPMPVED